MTTRFPSPRLATPLLLVALLSGCNSGNLIDQPTTWVDGVITTGRWKQMERAPDNEVEIVTIEHEVQFLDGTTMIRPESNQALSRFLHTSRVGPTDRVAIYGPRRDRGRHDPVTAERLQVLSSQLATLGVRSVMPEGQSPATGDPDAISVLVTRSVVISPDCAQQQPARGHRPRYNMGCSNTSLLGQMIVDPLDLKQGRPLGPADGEAAALSVQRYREDKVKELADSPTTSN